MQGLREARAITRVALVIAIVVLTGVVTAATQRLIRQDGLDASIQVDWIVWWVCVAGSCVGFGLVRWRTVDRARPSGQIQQADADE